MCENNRRGSWWNFRDRLLQGRAARLLRRPLSSLSPFLLQRNRDTRPTLPVEKRIWHRLQTYTTPATTPPSSPTSPPHASSPDFQVPADSPNTSSCVLRIPFSPFPYPGDVGTRVDQLALQHQRSLIRRTTRAAATGGFLGRGGCPAFILLFQSINLLLPICLFLLVCVGWVLGHYYRLNTESFCICGCHIPNLNIQHKHVTEERS